jgi:diguanylate cyclase (GGDEF)-like protein
MRLRSTTRSAGRGIPLWAHLSALVLVPTIGVLTLTTVLVRGAVAEADTATSTEAAVRAVARLDAARSSVQQEMLPLVTLTVLSDPATVATLSLPRSVQVGQKAQAATAVRRSREATGKALALVPEDAVGADTARAVADQLAVLRAQADSGQLGAIDLFSGYLQVSAQLGDAQEDAAVLAASERVSPQTSAAVHDVQLTSVLAQRASEQLPIFIGSQFTIGGAAVTERARWAQTWQLYLDAQRDMDDVSSDALRQAWDYARDSDAVSEIDTVLATEAAATESAPMSVLQLVPLVGGSPDRDAEFAYLVGEAAEAAEAAAAQDRADANDRRDRTLATALVFLLVALAGALLLGRRVARSLGLLADAADEVRRGRLVQVPATGPREVRTVSTALDSAVASLRRIQAQSAAVANGDLTDPVLDQPLPGPLGEVVHASVQRIVESARERERLQSALGHQATHDPLTGLANRAQARALVTSALHRAQRAGFMTGLLFIDLDGFKAVNDGFGHAHGDAVLQEVARRLEATVRSGDVVARLGGDEFVVLVEQVGDERDLVELAERIVAAAARTITVDGAQVRIGASIGVAVARDAGTDPDVLFAEADAAAYRAKAHGRGRAEVFDDALRAELHARADLEAAITHGIRNGEMQLHYQPVLDVASGRLTGYEALIRWNRPGHGMVPPDSFIPTAEATRLICELDRWVLHEATRQLAEWRAEDPTTADRTLAVNVSGRHLAEASVVDDVLAALAASGFPAELLIVEVTETVLVDDPSAIDNLTALRSHGIAIAIDDFGTGFTSIGQLRSMPVDTLKIDRSFIASAEAGNRELVALIIRAAHTFGLTVVAEGVEEPDQLELLRADACDLVQGYLLSRPLPAAAVSAFRDGTHAPVA